MVASPARDVEWATHQSGEADRLRSKTIDPPPLGRTAMAGLTSPALGEGAKWSSLECRAVVARVAHNHEVAGSIPAAPISRRRGTQGVLVCVCYVLLVVSWLHVAGIIFTLAMRSEC